MLGGRTAPTLRISIFIVSEYIFHRLTFVCLAALFASSAHRAVHHDDLLGTQPSLLAALSTDERHEVSRADSALGR